MERFFTVWSREAYGRSAFSRFGARTLMVGALSHGLERLIGSSAFSRFGARTPLVGALFLRFGAVIGSSAFLPVWSAYTYGRSAFSRFGARTLMVGALSYSLERIRLWVERFVLRLDRLALI
ncbi:hypothetical protein [Oceanobacillus sp. J11TS1]|uniref:hypothetical protein n=1 Tax=Oceanobacillus sp. J11TS1 TaxID=2807191 RepID=UPI001BB42CD8|nr:hypothetical protein [Oceanobacillus sp. J11TS1]